MIKAKEKFKTYDGVVFCFIASVIIAVISLNIGLLTEPGKILPVGLSMRSGDMSSNILRGIDLAIEDLDLIRSGNAASELWRLLTFIHLDPFFYLALLLPQAAEKTVLLVGYYVRFGLCCSAMYFFMSEHIKLSRLFSALLAVMYAFSSQIVLTAQFASLMNMSIMIPVLMSAFDSYLQKRTWKAFAYVCLGSFGLAVTGGYGLISGIPLMILIALLMCISLYSTFKMAVTSWLKLLGGMLTGLALSAVFALPGLLSMRIKVDIAESFKNAKVNYTVFEWIRGTFLLRSGSIYQNTSPLFYVGILTLIAVIAFALNEIIPVRLKVAASAIIIVIHAVCCSSFLNEVVSVFGTAPLLNSSKLIFMEAVVFFVAGIGIRNIKGLGRGEYIASCLIPLFFLVISGNSTSGTTFASPIVISTFLGIIIEASLFYALAKEKISRKGKYFVLIALFLCVGVNASFIIFNNTIQKAAVDEYFKVSYGNADTENLIFDNDSDIPLLNDNNKYQLVPADLSVLMTGESVVDDINNMSLRAAGGKLFEEIYLKPSDKKETHLDGMNTYLLKEGINDLAFCPFTVEDGERLFIYCNAVNGASVSIDSGNGESTRAFTGPFITAIDSQPGEVTLVFSIKSQGEDACRISLLKLNEDVLSGLDALSGNADSADFLIDVSGVNGRCTVILPYAYDDTKIKVNGISCDTFEFCGKLAASFVCNSDSIMEVSIERKASGIAPGIMISAFAAAFLIAIPAFHMYNKKKNVSVEGTDTNA